MLPSRLETASAGLRSAVEEIALGEERAFAFLDAYERLPVEARRRLPDAVAALDRIDLALRDLRAAVRDLEARARAARPVEEPIVRLRERARVDPPFDQVRA